MDGQGGRVRCVDEKREGGGGRKRQTIKVDRQVTQVI